MNGSAINENPPKWILHCQWLKQMKKLKSNKCKITVHSLPFTPGKGIKAFQIL